MVQFGKQEHPDMNKAEKKRLCRILDCQKLSPEVRAHAVKNERLPLRTVVQVLFFEQEKGPKATNNILPFSQEIVHRGKQTPSTRDELAKLKLGPDEKSSRGEGTRRTAAHETSERDQHKMKRSDGKMPVDVERKAVRGEIEEAESHKMRESREEGMSGSKLEAKKIMQKGNRSSDHVREKGRDR